MLQSGQADPRWLTLPGQVWRGEEDGDRCRGKLGGPYTMGKLGSHTAQAPTPGLPPPVWEFGAVAWQRASVSSPVKQGDSHLCHWVVVMSQRDGEQPAVSKVLTVNVKR